MRSSSPFTAAQSHFFPIPIYQEPPVVPKPQPASVVYSKSYQYFRKFKKRRYRSLPYLSLTSIRKFTYMYITRPGQCRTRMKDFPGLKVQGEKGWKVVTGLTNGSNHLEVGVACHHRATSIVLQDKKGNQAHEEKVMEISS